MTCGTHMPDSPGTTESGRGVRGGGLKLVFVFPGQGSQHPGMVCDRLAEDPAARRVFDAASEISGMDVLSVCRDGDSSLLARTDICQLSVAATSLAWLALLLKDGYRPLGVAGHSLGEYCAACAAGCLDVEETLGLVWKRGRAMLECANRRPGSMLAILGLGAEEVLKIVEDAREEGFLHLANHNSSSQCVVAGDEEALRRMEIIVKAKGARTARLKVTGAFHTPAFAPAADVMREALKETPPRGPRLPFFSGFTGTLLRDGDSVARSLAEGIASPVLWRDVQRGLLESGAEGQLEVGPGKTLTAMARRDFPHLAFYHVSDILSGG